MEPVTGEGSAYAGVEEPAQEQEFPLTQTVDSAISALKADFDTATVKARTAAGLLFETAKNCVHRAITVVCCLSPDQRADCRCARASFGAQAMVCLK